MLINGLDLFSGIGGISLALSEWVRPVAYCEVNAFCHGVLFSRMHEGLLPRGPIWDDVTSLDGRQLRGIVDIVYGGFPCQDISIAGAGKGLAGQRSSLFFEIMRLVREIQPAFVFLENVPAIRTRGLDTVLKEFTKAGYDCRWTMLRASDLGAHHHRERWFLLAHTKSQRQQESGCLVRIEKGQPVPVVSRIRKNWSEGEPPLVGVANGIQFRSHRIEALGNSVVPDQAKEAFKRLIGIFDEQNNKKVANETH